MGNNGIINMNYKFLGIKDGSDPIEMENSFEGKTLLMILVKNYKSSMNTDILAHIRENSPSIKEHRLHNDLLGHVNSILDNTDPSKIKEYLDIRDVEDKNVFDIALLSAMKHTKVDGKDFGKIGSIPKEIFDAYATTINKLLDKEIDISNFESIEKNDDYNEIVSRNPDLQNIYNRIKVKYSEQIPSVDATIVETTPTVDAVPLVEATNEDNISAQPIFKVNKTAFNKLSNQCKTELNKVLDESAPLPQPPSQGGNKSQKKRKMRKKKAHTRRKAKKTIKKDTRTKQQGSRRTHKKKLK